MLTYLTGIKPTGKVHLGNFVSVIHPLIEKKNDNKLFCFIADGHSLTNPPKKPKQLNDAILHTAATWMACGLDTYLYRQSKIPEIFQLFWILSCFTSKGLLNRSHAYYSKTQENLNKGKSPDKNIYAGLFNYPVLMAADILLFDVDYVPIGPDQKQHLEITKETARKMNSFYNTSIFNIPDEIYLSEYEVPGLDGLKMSKSYNNEIPLFCSEKKLKKLIFKIPTNSKNKGEQKYRDESNIISLCNAVTKCKYMYELDEMLEQGEGWGEIKQFVFEKINDEIFDMRVTYSHLIDNPDKVYTKLRNNEIIIHRKARAQLSEIIEKIGLN